MKNIKKYLTFFVALIAFISVGAQSVAINASFRKGTLNKTNQNKKINVSSRMKKVIKNNSKMTNKNGTKTLTITDNQIANIYSAAGTPEKYLISLRKKSRHKSHNGVTKIVHKGSHWYIYMSKKNINAVKKTHAQMSIVIGAMGGPGALVKSFGHALKILKGQVKTGKIFVFNKHFKHVATYNQ